MKKLFLLILILVACTKENPVTLSEQVNLNGTWNITISSYYSQYNCTGITTISQNSDSVFFVPKFTLCSSKFKITNPDSVIYYIYPLGSPTMFLITSNIGSVCIDKYTGNSFSGRWYFDDDSHGTISGSKN